MLTYTLDHEKNLYESLYEKIKDDILTGTLKADQKLPSKRSFAQHMKISVVTIENAYAQLMIEGYIYSVEKKGYFVCALEKLTGNIKNKDSFVIKEKITENRISYQNAEEIDLINNGTSLDKFPFSVWSKLMREVLSEQNIKLLESVPYNGIFALREAIASHLYAMRGMTVSPEQIIVGAGTEYLYGLLIQLLGRDKTYAIENPGYKKIAQIYHYNDVHYEFIEMDEYGMSCKELAAGSADIAHISPAHHYPTGIVMPIKRRQEILNWAGEREGRYLIEDDYDSEFRFVGKPIQTIQSIDSNQKVIYINTFSKSLAPSFRISYMVLPEHLMEIFNRDLNFYLCTVPSMEQYTLAKFIAKGYFERHINRMRNYYKKLRDVILLGIEESGFVNKVNILEENSGLHFILQIKTELSDHVVKLKAAEKNLKISFLSEFYHREDDPIHCTSRENFRDEHMVVINYSGVSAEQILDSIEALSQLF